MGVNWDLGLIRWAPHRPRPGEDYPLNHLHPFRMEVVLPAKDIHPESTIVLHVAFGLHTFTRDVVPGDDPCDYYCDNRETRTFDADRYKLSPELPKIVRELDRRACQFAKEDNYVTIDVGSVKYAVFFSLKRWKEQGPNAILLVVQSAYALDAGKPNPAKGKIAFRALLGHTMRGTKPRCP